MRSTRLVLGLALAALALPATGAIAASGAVATLAAAASLSPDDAATLSPGQWVWRPDLATDGDLRIQVDLQAQLAYVYRGGTLIGLSTVSTGRDGYPTPVGTFPILQKQVEHRSTLYNDAPMPYMQRLTWDGVALHAGSVPGYRSSHGCVHLPDAFAKLLYGATALGAVVDIEDSLPLPLGDPNATSAVMTASAAAPTPDQTTATPPATMVASAAPLTTAASGTAAP